MKKLILICIVALVALVPAAKAEIVPLVADGGDETTATVVGTVEVTRDGGDLVVTFNTTGVWSLVTTHVGLALDPDDLDGKKGNPAPGQFTYSDGDYPTTSYTYRIPLDAVLTGLKKDKNDPVDWSAGGVDIIVAAHAVVQAPWCEGNMLDLPEYVTVEILEGPSACVNDPPDLDGPAYFPLLEIISPEGDTDLDGLFEAWCLNPNLLIGPIIQYPSNVILSYDDLTVEQEALVGDPEGLPCVNWVLNNLDDIMADGYNYADVQAAIWMMMGWDPDDGFCISLGDTYSDDNPGSPTPAEEIVALAGDCDFVPVCGDVVGIIIIPDELEGAYPQPIIVPVPVPCCDETAWGGIEIDPVGDPGDEDENGYGIDFPGSDWSMYIEFTVPAP